MVRIYAQTGEQGDALVDRIRSMTKEVELGDEFTGKVVKTTTFGAFVELAKGTDGLIHISNAAPGTNTTTVEEVINRGDELVKVSRLTRAGPHRPAPGGRPRDRGQVARGAGCHGHRRQGRTRRPWRTRPRPREDAAAGPGAPPARPSGPRAQQ